MQPETDCHSSTTAEGLPDTIASKQQLPDSVGKTRLVQETSPPSEDHPAKLPQARVFQQVNACRAGGERSGGRGRGGF